MALKKCKECGEKVSKKADACPNCGAPVKRKGLGCGGLIVFLIFLGVMGAVVSSIQETSRKADEQKRQAEVAQKLRNAEEKARVNFENNISEHYAQVERFVKNKNYSAAIPLLDNFKKYKQSSYKNIPGIDKEARTAIQLERLKSTPQDDAQARLEIYSILAGLHPQNEDYKNQKNHFQKIITEREQKQKAEAERASLIEKQFSGWDGSHRNLEKVIKESMNDPSSYDHEKTAYWDKGNFLIVQTTFRGKNAFGGTVKNRVKAKVDLLGNVIEIIEQGP